MKLESVNEQEEEGVFACITVMTYEEWRAIDITNDCDILPVDANIRIDVSGKLYYDIQAPAKSTTLSSSDWTEKR